MSVDINLLSFKKAFTMKFGFHKKKLVFGLILLTNGCVGNVPSEAPNINLLIQSLAPYNDPDYQSYLERRGPLVDIGEVRRVCDRPEGSLPLREAFTGLIIVGPSRALNPAPEGYEIFTDAPHPEAGSFVEPGYSEFVDGLIVREKCGGCAMAYFVKVPQSDCYFEITASSLQTTTMRNPNDQFYWFEEYSRSLSQFEDRRIAQYIQGFSDESFENLAIIHATLDANSPYDTELHNFSTKALFDEQGIVGGDYIIELGPVLNEEHVSGSVREIE